MAADLRNLGSRLTTLYWPSPLAIFALLVHFNDAHAQLPLEYTPYAIDVHVALDDPADLSTESRQRFHARLLHLASAFIGPAWTIQSGPARGAMVGEMLTRFETATAQRLVELTAGEHQPHKAMFVHLRTMHGHWSVAVRELDYRTYQLSPVLRTARVPHDRLTDAVLETIVAAFSPLAELRAAQGDVATGTLQASHLIPGDESPLLVRKGEPLVPIVRRNDRLGRAGPKDVLPIGWTVLETRELDGANLTCQIHSAHVNPLGGKRRLRLQRYAQAIRYPPRAARLTLQTPDELPNPLVGYDIIQRDAGTGDAHVVGRTGDDGSTVLGPSAEPWRVLYVRHGDRFLARLPMIAGWSDHYLVTLPSDDVRLAAEGFVSAFRQEIVDTVARRQILATRIRRRIADGQFDEAQALLEEFRQLAGARQFGQRMDAARAELVADNTRAQQLIDQMFNETRQTLQRYLTAGEADALAKQLAAARAEG